MAKEKDLRHRIAFECWGFEANFSQIDILSKMEHDWTVAQKEGDYNFENCPCNFECLKDFTGLCENTNEDFSKELCVKCWEKALKENKED